MGGIFCVSNIKKERYVQVSNLRLFQKKKSVGRYKLKFRFSYLFSAILWLRVWPLTNDFKGDCRAEGKGLLTLWWRTDQCSTWHRNGHPGPSGPLSLLLSGPKKESVGVSRRPKEHLKYIVHFSESSTTSWNLQFRNFLHLVYWIAPHRKTTVVCK